MIATVDFGWSSEQEELRQLARSFGEKEIAPHVSEYDRDERFPREIVERAGQLGLAGGIVPPEYGGAGLDHMTYAMAMEEISRFCHVVACALTFPSGLVGNSILRYGTEEQKQRYLAPLARAEHFGGAAPDLISIDIEALDYPVLKSLDMTRFRPKVVCVETVIFNTLRHTPETPKLMAERGYELRGLTYANAMFVDKAILKDKK